MTGRLDAVHLDHALADLVGDGTLSGEQADAVRAAVARRAGRPAADDQPGGLTVVAAYVGVALLVAAVATFLAQQWDRLGATERTVMFGGLAALMVVVGALARGREESLADRVRGIVWLLAVGVAAAAGAAVLSDEESLGAALGAAALAVPLYAVRRQAAQLLGLLGAVVAGVVASAETADVDMLVAGVIVAGAGAAFALASAAGVLRPQDVGYVGGALMVFAGAEIAWFDTELVGALIAAVLAVTSYGLAAVRDDLAALVVATVTVAIFAPQILGDVFGDGLGMPFVLLLSGLVVLGAVAVHVRLVQRRRQ